MLQTIQTPSPVIISNYLLRPRSGARGEQEFFFVVVDIFIRIKISVADVSPQQPTAWGGG